MLETLVIVTIITLMISAPVIALAANKAKKECRNENLKHPERIMIRGH